MRLRRSAAGHTHGQHIAAPQGTHRGSTSRRTFMIRRGSMFAAVDVSIAAGRHTRCLNQRTLSSALQTHASDEGQSVDVTSHAKAAPVHCS